MQWEILSINDCYAKARAARNCIPYLTPSMILISLGRISLSNFSRGAIPAQPRMIQRAPWSINLDVHSSILLRTSSLGLDSNSKTPKPVDITPALESSAPATRTDVVKIGCQAIAVVTMPNLRSNIVAACSDAWNIPITGIWTFSRRTCTNGWSEKQQIRMPSRRVLATASRMTGSISAAEITESVWFSIAAGQPDISEPSTKERVA